MHWLWYLCTWTLSATLLGCQAAATGPFPAATKPQPTPELNQTTRTASIQLPTNTIKVIEPAAIPISTATQAAQVEKIPLAPSPAQPSLLTLDPIQIRSPGPGSNVISPIPIEVQLALGKAGSTIRIELYGKDGRLLARKVLARMGLTLPGDTLTERIEYEISADSEDGRIVIGVDETPGIPIAVNSADLTLLSSGPAVIETATWQAKWIDIQGPGYGAEISNGMLTVSGLTRQDAARLLKLRLFSAEGKVISQALAKIHDSPGTEFKDFTAQMLINVQQPTHAWVVVYAESNPGEIVTHLASLPVTLIPHNSLK